jgi:glycosyltransferase 2 family protein
MNWNGSGWRWTRRLLAAAFFIAVAVLLVTQARQVEWSEVGAAIRRADPLLLGAAALLAVASYLLYASYDLMARRYTGHTLSRRVTTAVALVSYAFNLNMGALIGGAGFRFRLYSRLGLSTGTITRILSFSVASNWAGYVLLAGLLLTFRQFPVTLQWKLGEGALQAIGVLLLVAAVSYPLLCRFSRRRDWTIRGHELNLPSLPMALLQLGLSSLNWMTIALIVFVLLPDGPTYTIVLGVLLAAAVAGAVTHVPAGLGVLEAVFVVALSSRASTSSLLAALLTYRAIYYLLPLMLAVPAYLLLERRAQRAGNGSTEGKDSRAERKPAPGHPHQKKGPGETAEARPS